MIHPLIKRLDIFRLRYQMWKYDTLSRDELGRVEVFISVLAFMMGMFIGLANGIAYLMAIVLLAGVVVLGVCIKDLYRLHSQYRSNL